MALLEIFGILAFSGLMLWSLWQLISLSITTKNIVKKWDKEDRKNTNIAQIKGNKMERILTAMCFHTFNTLISLELRIRDFLGKFKK